MLLNEDRISSGMLFQIVEAVQWRGGDPVSVRLTIALSRR
jgi:hypothetical protein